MKSRSLAQKLIKSKGVRVNKEPVKSPSHVLKMGDVLTFALPRGIKVYRVLQPGERRGPAPEAQTLYEDLSPPPTPLTPEERATKGKTPAPEKRPDKRARRDLMRLKGLE